MKWKPRNRVVFTYSNSITEIYRIYRVLYYKKSFRGASIDDGTEEDANLILRCLKIFHLQLV